MEVKEDLCIGCGQCVIVCPVQAIQIINDKAIINNEILPLRIRKPFFIDEYILISTHKNRIFVNPIFYYCYICLFPYPKLFLNSIV